MMHLLVVGALALAGDALSDEALVAYASQPYDKAAMAFHHEVLGIASITEPKSSPISPARTSARIIPCGSSTTPWSPVRIATRSAASRRRGPVSIAVMRRPFCVPKVLVEKKLD